MRTYGAFVSERDQRGRVTVGAGIPAGPDVVEQPAGDGAGADDRGPEGAEVAAPEGVATADGHSPDRHPDQHGSDDQSADGQASDDQSADGHAPVDQPPDDMVQAVADFVDDLVDDAAADRTGDAAR